MSSTDLHEIRYRSDSTNMEALSGSNRLAALDRCELIEHIDAREAQMRKALKEAAEKAYATWKNPEVGIEVAWAAGRTYDNLVAVALDMGLYLINL